MKLLSYKVGGRPEFGAIVGDRVVRLSRDGTGPRTLRAAIASGLTPYAQQSSDQNAGYAMNEVEFLPTITDPEKIICVGFNYKSHADEAHRDLPEFPSLFLRLTNTLVGHNDALIRPKVSTRFDFEGELAVIVGVGGRHISEQDALKHVAGYTCFIDGSVRDYQKHSVTAGKNFIGTGPLGPWMVTADEIPDPTKLTLTTRLNGSVMQNSATDMLVYSIPAMISYVSRFTPLAPGDVIATGTPAGVGHRRDPQVWMKAGDVLEVEISGIGTLRNHVVDES